MGVNNAENNIKYGEADEVARLRREFNEYRTTPQKGGNGMINYAVFGSGFAFGPTTIAAGATTNFSVIFMDVGLPFTYDGLPAKHRRTLFETIITPFVDTLDAAHAWPFGASLTTGQRKLSFMPPYSDSVGSGLEEDNGQRLIVFGITNTDSSSHNYYIEGNAIIPRPELDRP